ncbi:N-acetylglucosaminyldiphosphoundecaprenol N-acetyl-beta-D-mannosaminyltransferase [Roseibaca ekhonensis]|uniref:N-acetylglucosaminyldiphosphoundecaprenol N-acetyl-beta-D-mannosaminyltransferase n=1 Tax=Roseinatronobacter ekhonensis TaxID=254356 RepID=A0A3B0MBD8_9RHOB|nr:WecB/TagA/CpsF family glycosyltransferase [Roseibaca ekhonensis]SUZ33172.1 N-acetylglucosaminyldiphosphoundecaprenol N-acetyl-beta-D-mannosaminyltransferase [Roseibaca ekhonensis]
MPELPTLRLFGLDLISASRTDAIRDLLARPHARVAFVNAHCVNVAARDDAYRHALQSADMLLPDGAGLELAAKLHGVRFAANLNGTDLGPELAHALAEDGHSLFLLGAAPGVAERAGARLQELAPKLRIAGTRDGFAGLQNPQAAIDAINSSGADMVWMATGVPHQDLWLAEHAHALNARHLLGVGALLDFLSGRVARAPIMLRRARLEWAWRLALEPRRMFGRYILGNAAFILRALAHRVTGDRSQNCNRSG